MIKPAGYENAQGIITAAYLKDPTDKQWDNAEDMKAWRAWMAKNMPNASTLDANYIFAHAVATIKDYGDRPRKDLYGRLVDVAKRKTSVADAELNGGKQPETVAENFGENVLIVDAESTLAETPSSEPTA